MQQRLFKAIQAAVAGLIGVVMLVVAGAMAQSPSGDLIIAGYELISSKRVGRTTFEYEYAVNVNNGTSSDVENVAVSVSSTSPNVTVVDGEAGIGPIASGTTATSRDTIAVQVDRRNRFSPDNLESLISFEDTDSLKSYTNEEFAFSLQVPRRFDTLEIDSTLPNELYSRVFVDLGGSESVIVSVFQYSGYNSISEWYDDTLSGKEFVYDDSSGRVEREIFISGTSALEFESNLLGVKIYRVFVPHNDTVISISTSAPEELPAPPVYQTIVSTVTF